VFGRQLRLAALPGQPCKLVVRREALRRQSQRVLLALDAGAQGLIDILESLLCGCARAGVARLADAIEHAARFGLHLGFIAQESVLQRDMEIGGIKPHRRGELIARGLGLAHLQIGVRQILAD
jgi:hypothetical protein